MNAQEMFPLEVSARNRSVIQTEVYEEMVNELNRCWHELNEPSVHDRAMFGT